VRLGKGFKINMIIAILLCMAFVVNIGATLASVSYSFISGSVNTTVGETTKHQTYTQYANAQGVTGQYAYSVGSVNNQLSINYGFSHEHDLKVKFVATYTNEEHKANDFSLNFVNRDKWCIDMAIAQGLAPAGETAQTYYSLASSSNTISGVMYYMGTLTGSGTIPIIRGVNFYTSFNNSYTYIGDILTVTLTVQYEKSKDSNYTTTAHAFKDDLLTANITAFTNWIDYMAETTLNAPRYMLYNAYANNSTALQYPSDYNWSASGFNITEQTEPLYSNTAYRYAISKHNDGGYHTDRTYSSVIAGNKYYGGVGVYVFPTESLKTIGITIDYHWQKAGVVLGTTPNNMVHVKYDDDNITEIQRTTEDDKTTPNVDESGTYYSYYYRDEIDAPTYINVLDYIMLTAEGGYRTILENGYSLVITNISVTSEMSNPSDWTSSDKLNYHINNATEQSPVLVRIKDVATGSKTYETSVSIYNDGIEDFSVTSFKVKARLWYANYTDQNNSEFSESHVAYLPVDSLVYDESMWNVAYENDTYTFTRKTAVGYITTGYGINLISSITVPKQYYPAVDDEDFVENSSGEFNTISVNDLWCELQISDVQITNTISYSQATYTGVEVNAEGYYSVIEADDSSSIYLCNNTKQDITTINLTGLRLATLNSASSSLLPRDNLNTSTEFNYSLKNCIKNTTKNNVKSNVDTNETINNVLIRPNEKVLLYTITPKSKAVIYSYHISVTLTSDIEDRDVDLIFNINKDTTINETAQLVNNSSTHYEFRITSSTDLSDCLLVDSDFIEHEVSGTYYYYYKGVIYAHQCIDLFNKYADSVDIDSISHVDNADETYYVASNYTTWNPPEDWLTSMKAIYGEPNRDEAIVVSVQ